MFTNQIQHVCVMKVRWHTPTVEVERLNLILVVSGSNIAPGTDFNAISQLLP